MDIKNDLRLKLRIDLQGAILRRVESFRQQYLFYNQILNWDVLELVSNVKLNELIGRIDFEIKERVEIESIGLFKMRNNQILNFCLVKNGAFEDLKSMFNRLENRLGRMKLLREKIIELRSSLSSANERLEKFQEHRESHSEESIQQQRQKTLRIEREINSILYLDFDQIPIEGIEGELSAPKEFAQLENQFNDIKIFIGDPYYSKSHLISLAVCMSVIFVFSFYYINTRITRSREEDQAKLTMYKREIEESVIYKTAILPSDMEKFHEMNNYKDAFLFSDEMVANNEDFMRKLTLALLGACSFSFNTKTGFISNKAEIGQIMKLEALVGQDIEIQTFGKVGLSSFEFGTCFGQDKSQKGNNIFNVKTICEGISDIGFRLKVFVGTKLFKFEIKTPNTGTTANLNRDIKKSVFCRR